MKIFRATPAFTDVSGVFNESMIRAVDLYSQVGMPMQHRTMYDASWVTLARSVLVQEFLDSDCTHLLFIDADNGFEPQYMLEILNAQIATGYDVLGAPYLKKNIHWDKVLARVDLFPKIPREGLDINRHTGDWTVGLLDGTNYDPADFSEHQPFEVEYISMGFTIIPRATFALFKQAYPEFTYGGGMQTLYFPSGIFNDVHMLEDVSFCHLIRKAGGRIGCCPWMRITHAGSHVYG